MNTLQIPVITICSVLIDDWKINTQVSDMNPTARARKIKNPVIQLTSFVPTSIITRPEAISAPPKKILVDGSLKKLLILVNAFSAYS